MKKALIISPHLDDETLGCGGTILKYSKNINFDFLLVTRPAEQIDYLKILELIDYLALEYNFQEIYKFEYMTASLSLSNCSELIDKIRKLNIKNEYSYIFTPFINDIHTDHKIITHSTISAFKSFRSSSNKIFMYETLSETNFSIEPYKPNKYVDISDQMEKKLEILSKFDKEVFQHPFSRSLESVRSLGILRGSESNNIFAESFYIFNDNLDGL